jgi:hypothetical protein
MALPVNDQTYSVEMTLDELLKLATALEKDIGQSAALHAKLVRLIIPMNENPFEDNGSPSLELMKSLGLVRDGTSAETVGSPTLTAIMGEEPEGGV